MMEFIEMIFPVLMTSLGIGAFLFLLYLTGRTKPLFKMKCHLCWRRDRNWEIVATGHDDFAWQHRCGRDPK